MDRMVNNNQLTWKLVWILRTYRTCNSTVRFSKYEFYKKLLGGITLLEVIPDVTWIQPYIYIYICVCVCVYVSYFETYKKRNNDINHIRCERVIAYSR